MLEGEELGVLTIMNDSGEMYSQDHVRLLSMLNKPFAIALTNGLRYRELKKFEEKLEDDKRYLQAELSSIGNEKVIGADFGLKSVMIMVRQVARLDSPVLLQGETGVGKELIANTIHGLSPRRDGVDFRNHQRRENTFEFQSLKFGLTAGKVFMNKIRTASDSTHIRIDRLKPDEFLG